MVLAVVSGCTVSPPPAPQSTDTTESTPPPPVKGVTWGNEGAPVPGTSPTCVRFLRQPRS